MSGLARAGQGFLDADSG